jgi:hypothetical protein
MSILTFEQFQASKKHVDDIREAVGFDDDQGLRGGYVYDLGCYIEDAPNGGYYLIIERSDYVSSDLAELEAILYRDWYVAEARANERQDFAAIIEEPSPTVRKFKLMKRFGALLPENAKELSATSIATVIHSRLGTA